MPPPPPPLPMTDGSKKPKSNRVKLIPLQEETLKLFAQAL